MLHKHFLFSAGAKLTINIEDSVTDAVGVEVAVVVKPK